MSNNFKTCPALLYLLLLLGKASCNYFETELSLANDKTCKNIFKIFLKIYKCSYSSQMLS